MHILDKLDSAESRIRFNIPIVLGMSFLQRCDKNGIHINTAHYSSYIQMKLGEDIFKEFCTNLVWSEGYKCYNVTLGDAAKSLHEGTGSQQQCIEALLACCHYGPRDPKDDAFEKAVYERLIEQED